MLRPCPLSISCRAGRSEGDKAAISRSTVATQPRGGESSQGKYFSAKKYIFTQNQNSRVFHNRKAFPIWWWWWIRTVEAQDCPVLAPLVSGNPTFRRCLANTRPIRPLHSHDPGDYHHRINHMSTTNYIILSGLPLQCTGVNKNVDTALWCRFFVLFNTFLASVLLFQPSSLQCIGDHHHLRNEYLAWTQNNLSLPRSLNCLLSVVAFFRNISRRREEFYITAITKTHNILMKQAQLQKPHFYQ